MAEMEETDTNMSDNRAESMRSQDDDSLLQRDSPPLLLFHALARKPSFVHLQLDSCGISPHLVDHMPVWPHLLCLSVYGNDELAANYTFAGATQRFPSLTSLTSPTCSDDAIEQLVQLPQLEELQFLSYPLTGEGGSVQTTDRGFSALSQAASLRSVQYSPANRWEEGGLTVAALTSLLTITHLTRLTINAQWLLEEQWLEVHQLTHHRSVHLRCLELIEQRDVNDHICCEHTDAVLLPLVKPADIVVAGREQRQTARAAKRPDFGEEMNHDADEVLHIPTDNAANFPALECLALPYRYYNTGENTGYVSAWMKQQLRRSYEYELVEEWEAEQQTLGEAELVKSIHEQRRTPSQQQPAGDITLLQRSYCTRRKERGPRRRYAHTRQFV